MPSCSDAGFQCRWRLSVCGSLRVSSTVQAVQAASIAQLLADRVCLWKPLSAMSVLNMPTNLYGLLCQSNDLIACYSPGKSSSYAVGAKAVQAMVHLVMLKHGVDARV